MYDTQIWICMYHMLTPPTICVRLCIDMYNTYNCPGGQYMVLYSHLSHNAEGVRKVSLEV